jgi:hypothetical protein
VNRNARDILHTVSSCSAIGMRQRIFNSDTRRIAIYLNQDLPSFSMLTLPELGGCRDRRDVKALSFVDVSGICLRFRMAMFLVAAPGSLPRAASIGGSDSSPARLAACATLDTGGVAHATHPG